jgi:hypothetical protein
MPHLGVATLTGVARNGIGQGGYLLEGFEHLLAYETIAPGAAGRTFVAALKLIESATRTDYAVGIGRCMGLLFHCVSFSLDRSWLPDQIPSEPLVLLSTLFSTLLRFPPGGVPMGMKASVLRGLVHLPHGYVSYVTWPFLDDISAQVAPTDFAETSTRCL